MRLRNALNEAIQRLEQNAIGSPRLNAEVLLMFTLACDRAYLYAHPERELTADELARYNEALAERSRGVPSQYITGHQEFWGLDFIVTPAVLIPRPDTEHLVETVVDLVRNEYERIPGPAGGKPEGRLPPGPRIIDVGTGSGCIALALAHELPAAEIWATDISPAALEVARINATRLQLAERVRFFISNLLDALPASEIQATERFDFIVSNPPYVGEGEADKVQREVKKFEPQEAVFAGPEGLDVIKRLISQAQAYLSPGGWLVMEIGYSQEQKVRSLLTGWSEVRTVPDLQGIPRVIAGKL